MKKTRFANWIIALCVVMSAAITAAALYEYHRLDTVLPASVLTALLGLWGGELLIIALRQIFGSDVLERRGRPSDGRPADGERNSPRI